MGVEYDKKLYLEIMFLFTEKRWFCHHIVISSGYFCQLKKGGRKVCEILSLGFVGVIPP